MPKSSHYKVHRVQASDPAATGRAHDYADAFEVQLTEPDGAPPEAWVLNGLADSPAVVDWVATRVLGHGSSTPGTATERVVDGWRVVQSTSDVVQLEQSLPLMQVTVMGRNVDPSTRRLTSVLSFERPVLSRLVWAVVGVGHRGMVRRLLRNAAATASKGTRTGPAA